MCPFRCELWDGSRDMQIGHEVRSIFSSLKYILLKYNTRTNEHERERGRERESLLTSCGSLNFVSVIIFAHNSDAVMSAPSPTGYYKLLLGFYIVINNGTLEYFIFRGSVYSWAAYSLDSRWDNLSGAIRGLGWVSVGYSDGG